MKKKQDRYLRFSPKKIYGFYQDGPKLLLKNLGMVIQDFIFIRHGEDVDWLVPHQANLRIIDATANRMGLTKDKVMINIEKYGNTTSATIPLCLWEWEKKLKKGDNIVLAAFGGGFTWGSVYLKWAY